ncbi:PAS domain S-box protein [Candidatus Obscuribacterales bacterium]|nr:PAS domain S-box protein [Candidatus Obscuribacterales bacterium]
MKLKNKFLPQILFWILAPFVLQLVFIAVLLPSLSQLEDCYYAEERASSYLSANVKFLTSIMTCAASQAIYQATRDPRYLSEFQELLKSAARESDNLKQLGKRTLKDPRELSALETLFTALHQMSEAGQRAIETQDQVEMAVAFTEAGRVISRAKGVSLSVLQELTAERRKIADRKIAAKNRIFEIVLLTSATYLIFLLLFYLRFFSTVSERFKRLGENINSLGANQKLKYALASDDEISELDRTLHRVAGVLAESRFREQAIVTNAVDVICALDDSNRFTQVNPATERLLGQSGDDLLGKNVLSYVSPDDRERVVAELQSMRDGGNSGEFELRLVTSVGAVVETHWTVTFSREMKTAFCVARDVTERKRLERLRRELVEMVSHDLRSPMTSMQVTLNILASGALGEFSVDAQKRLHRVENSLAQLLTMLDDFLEVERLEYGGAKLLAQSTSALNIVEQSCALLDDLALANGIALKVETEEFMFDADASQLTRVLTNLIGNAIKFSPAGSTVKIIARKESDSAVFLVVDQGRGIPREQQESMFERFRQLEVDDARVKKGFGLGLAVCKSIVEAHGGVISVKSEVDKGSTFIVKVPLTHSQAAAITG